ncbi:MAG: flavodoxin domain-containing protein [Verrucomicrobiota bacterium]|nr:flavodoxin domain-containing protein [Verrucomicrobiota bacterium]
MPTTPQIPTNAPFNEAQRLWLNGYIAGIISQSATERSSQESEKKKTKKRIPIVFASQSGNSQSLAEQFGNELENTGFEAPVYGAEEFEDIDLTNEEFLLLISSTWGDGDPPDNAVEFWNHITSEDHPRLEKLQYSVLGLGDKNYLHFCAMGEKFDSRLKELGAKRLTPRGECDVDYEETAENWFNGVLKKLDTPIKKETSIANTDAYSKKNPFSAKVLLNKNLNEQESQKQTHHIEFDLSGSNLSYEAGDVLGIYPTNDPELIDELITNLNFDPDELVDDKKLKEILLYDFDIRNLTKDFVLAWLDKSSSESLGKTIKNTSLEEYITGREIIDLIVD